MRERLAKNLVMKTFVVDVQFVFYIQFNRVPLLEFISLGAPNKEIYAQVLE
jgi:hypothetical protein